MELQQVAEADPLFLRYHAGEVGFDLVGIGLCRQPEALRQPHDVRVDADRRLAEGIAEQNVRGLAPD
jgi:hypothetical protein